MICFLLGGQGICHGYHYNRGQTGGWTDVYCEHLFRVGSKMQACQESVSDPADVLFSMTKWPVLGNGQAYYFNSGYNDSSNKWELSQAQHKFGS